MSNIFGPRSYRTDASAVPQNINFEKDKHRYTTQYGTINGNKLEKIPEHTFYVMETLSEKGRIAYGASGLAQLLLGVATLGISFIPTMGTKVMSKHFHAMKTGQVKSGVNLWP